MNNKLKYLILPIMSIIGIFFCNEKVKATTYESLTIEPQQNVYYTMTNNDGYFSADPFSYYSMNGKTVYCIEQGVRIDTNSYIGEDGFTNSPLPLEINQKIELIGHYGYDFPNHQTLKFRMATQALIWETITGNDVNFYTENYGWGDYIDVSYEREQIMNLVNNHYIRPSFNNQSYNVILNQELIIEDTNYKINEFKVYNNSNGHDVKIENNKVIIKPQNTGNSNITFLRQNYDTSTTFFYVASDGYSQKLAFFRSSDPMTASIYLNVIGGKIKILKQDSETKSCKASGQSSLIGAKYGVYDNNNTLVDTLIIDSNCSATSQDLPYGRYKVKEIESSLGYKLDSNIYDVEVNSTNVIEIISNETVVKGKIKVVKQDSDTKGCKASGQSSLIGAKYGVYDNNNTLVDTLIIDSNCSATSQDLPYGRYKVKEIESSLGYEIDPNIYDVNITNEKIIEITSKENVIKNDISILKQYDFVDGNTTFLNAESGIIFEIFYQDGTKYGEVTTDKNGYARFEIPFGIWKLHQKNSTTGFEKIYDFFITVDENSEKIQYYNILNNSLSAYLQVIKIDEETGKTIAIKDTTFKIFNLDTNQYISQYVGGKVISEFKTNENGILITPLKLTAGNYKLIEISAPNGYLKDKNGLVFTIGSDSQYNYTTYGAFITVTYKNTPVKGQLEIYKTGETVNIENSNFIYEETPLENVIFEIYANEDIYSTDGNYLYYNKNDLVDTIITDENGYAISSKLPLGNYYLIEVKTQDGYILDEDKHYFTLKQIDDETPIVSESYNTLNYLKKGTLEFLKTDLTSGKEIPNVKIEIYTSDDKLVYSDVTDKNGKIIIKNLFVGKFYIIETETLTGYKLSDEKVYFEILENGEVVKASMTNEKIKGNLEFTKVDLSSGNPIPNVLFEIYNFETDELIFSGRTDENGKIIIKNLEYGKYYILEKEAPENYILNDEKMFFEILENGQIVKATMTNEKVEMPKTFNTDITSIIIIGCTTLIGLGLLVYGKKKN